MPHQTLNRCTLHLGERIVCCGDHIVPLPPKAFEVLAALVEHRGDVVAKSALMDAAWADTAVEESNLAQSIYQLRRVLRDWDPCVRIETVPRRGYRLVVNRNEPSPALARKSLRRVFAGLAAAAVLVALCTFWWRGSHRGTGPPPASYALGYYYWSHAKSASDTRKAIAYFDRAVAQAPDSALAYAGLADAYLSLAVRHIGTLEMTLDARQAFQAAREAVALDASSADAHAALGQAHSIFGDAGIAARELRRAVDLDPTLVEAHTWYGELLMGQARIPEAQAQFRDALAINTSWTDAGDNLALLAYLQRDDDEAEAYAEQSLAQDPHDAGAQFTLALAEGKRDRRSAEQLLMTLARAHPGQVAVEALLSYYESEDGDPVHARQHLDLAEQAVRKQGAVQDPSAIVSLAAALAARNHAAIAFAWLSRIDPSARKLFANDARLDVLRPGLQPK